VQWVRDNKRHLSGGERGANLITGKGVASRIYRHAVGFIAAEIKCWKVARPGIGNFCTFFAGTFAIRTELV
jgi:hypothetical protein